jgi:large subunit ribosomal protein L23
MALAKQNKFTFLVAPAAKKETIRKAIEDTFKVSVTGIETNTQKGKSKRVGMRRTEKHLQPFKKAVVTLKEGQKIDMFDLGV